MERTSNFSYLSSRALHEIGGIADIPAAAPTLRGFSGLYGYFVLARGTESSRTNCKAGFQCGFQCPEGLVGGPRSLLERGTGKGVSHWSAGRRQSISIPLSRPFPPFHILDQTPTQLFNPTSCGLFLFADRQEGTLVRGA